MLVRALGDATAKYKKTHKPGLPPRIWRALHALCNFFHDPEVQPYYADFAQTHHQEIFNACFACLSAHGRQANVPLTEPEDEDEEMAAPADEKKGEHKADAMPAAADVWHAKQDGPRVNSKGEWMLHHPKSYWQLEYFFKNIVAQHKVVLSSFFVGI